MDFLGGQYKTHRLKLGDYKGLFSAVSFHLFFLGPLQMLESGNSTWLEMSPQSSESDASLATEPVIATSTRKFPRSPYPVKRPLAFSAFSDVDDPFGEYYRVPGLELEKIQPVIWQDRQGPPLSPLDLNLSSEEMIYLLNKSALATCLTPFLLAIITGDHPLAESLFAIRNTLEVALLHILGIVKPENTLVFLGVWYTRLLFHHRPFLVRTLRTLTSICEVVALAFTVGLSLAIKYAVDTQIVSSHWAACL
ncbi:hypothetical protein C8J56DRAFT_560538 [Mycena floridula]|nr:hypothetical protein C8J56DRAFT_560538 [Mycena floridula]